MSLRAIVAAIGVVLFLIAGAAGTAFDVWAYRHNHTTITVWLRRHGIGWAVAVGIFAGLLSGISVGHVYGEQSEKLSAAMAATFLSLILGMAIAQRWLQ